jgi:hypothetical protein
MKLTLEVNQNCIDKTDKFVGENSNGQPFGFSICPVTSPDYWMFRVKLHREQAVLGFPKFGMIGVGMAVEKDGNTNLPLSPLRTPQENAEKIANHIFCNKRYKVITKDMIVEAVRMIEDGAKQYCENGERAYYV